MSKEKVYPGGIRVFNKKENQPDFVLGDVVINLNEFFKWAKENVQYQSDYKGEKQIKLQVLNGNNGPYLTVNTFVPSAYDKAPADNNYRKEAYKHKEEVKDDLPF